MKITLSQEEIKRAIFEYLDSKDVTFDEKSIDWDVTWDKQYDLKPTNIEVSLQLG